MPDQNHKLESTPADLSRKSLAWRFAVVVIIIVLIVGLFAYAGGWLTPHTLTSARIVNRFEVLNGAHAGTRRNHAKGVSVNGWFDSNGQGVLLSQASIFQVGRVAVIGRFSLSGGQPYAADAALRVRGLAILFKLSHGEEWRTAMINLPVFPVSTPQAFYEQLLASAADPMTGKPNPAKMQLFLEKYPESGKAAKLIHNSPMSSGFENSTFNSLDAFQFVNAAGEVKSVRWALVPIQPYYPTSAESHNPTDTNYLFDALIADVHHHPLQWYLMVTVAQPGDPTDNATLPWPPDRQTIDVGTLTIDQIESDDSSLARDLNFDPLILPNGITASDDPLLSARSAVYSQSFTRREGEPKSPSAVSPAETGK